MLIPLGFSRYPILDDANDSREPAGVAVAILCLSIVSAVGACRREEPEPPPVATPSFSVKQNRVPAGSPVEMTYKFVVAASAPKITENYRVFVHFLDADKERLWTDDHDLPVPTTQWKPGQVIEYTKTMFVPVYLYEGATKVLMGLYSNASDFAVPLAGTSNGQRAYDVGSWTCCRRPKTFSSCSRTAGTPAETPPDNAAVEWQWRKRKQRSPCETRRRM